ncbi:MAG: DUF4192 domain-containing protein [Rhodococcus sp. (in: high G+C Gram-positive bacteria)]
MTTHPETHSSLPPSERIAGSGALLAAVPALLGFIPHRSLILLCLEGAGLARPTVGTVMRHDLGLGGGDDGSGFGRTVTRQMADVIEQFCGICARDGVRMAVALIVDDRASATVAGTAVDPRFRAVARQLSAGLRTRGTILTQAFLTSEMVRGAAWVTLTGPAERGMLPSPDTSPVTLAYMVEGRGIHASRETLVDVLRPLDTCPEVTKRLRDARSGSPNTDRERLENIMDRLTHWASAPSDRPAPIELGPQDLAEFGVSLTHIVVRDALLALALTELADIAERLWTYMMRRLPAPERACAATLLAFTAYARGEGPLAAVAVEIALDADGSYSLARLLERSLLAGARPEMIREVASSGYAVAELCGVRLPPPLDRNL